MGDRPAKERVARAGFLKGALAPLVFLARGFFFGGGIWLCHTF